MPWTVLLSQQAERDLDDIYGYIAERDGPARADRVLAALEQTVAALTRFPERGNVPKELQALGLAEYREAHYKPYRVIYRVLGKRVVVYAVLDGRRDLHSLLQRRLVR
ncbi:MAG: type II toxin-antitoxin system RelE/ParE family toxin [Alphaproteobacteria bacterium]|nr:type II toxin-antitoxin system RelE/ParE family toxin [Alphaproteobacteria bacterium]